MQDAERFRRYYKLDKNGERVYYTDEERAAMDARAKEEYNKYCQ
jgi:hypothetical protein